MEKIDNYIVEKFKISKNTANNNLYRVNDEFIIDPEKDYYTIKFLSITGGKLLNKSHIIYTGKYRDEPLIVLFLFF